MTIPNAVILGQVFRDDSWVFIRDIVPDCWGLTCAWPSARHPTFALVFLVPPVELFINWVASQVLGSQTIYVCHVCLRVHQIAPVSMAFVPNTHGLPSRIFKQFCCGHTSRLGKAIQSVNRAFKCFRLCAETDRFVPMFVIFEEFRQIICMRTNIFDNHPCILQGHLGRRSIVWVLQEVNSFRKLMEDVLKSTSDLLMYVHCKAVN